MRRALILVALAIVAGAHASVVVYDNITENPEGFYWPAGQQLAADDTTVSDLSLPIISATLDFYAPTAYNGVNLTVGLWSSLEGQGTQLASKTVTFDVAEPNYSQVVATFDNPVYLPTTNIWTSWQFDGDNGEYGMFFGATPTVGTSENLFAKRNPDGTWGTAWFGSYSLLANAAIKLDAEPVPEPASVIAIGAGLAALAARRRRK